MGHTRLSQRRAEVRRNRSREATNLQDGETKVERRQAEKSLARIISRNAIIIPATQKYGLPRGKFEELFDKFGAVYSELNVSAARVKTLVYRYYLKDKNDALPPINVAVDDDDAVANDEDAVADVDLDDEEVSLCCLCGFYKTLF